METFCYRIVVCVVICIIKMEPVFGCQDWEHPWCHVNNTCPSSSPFLKMNGSHKECVKTCGQYYVLRDTFCIDVEQCDRAIVDDGRCLEMCPEGYLYFPNSFLEFIKLPDNTDYHLKGEEHLIRCQKTINCVFVMFWVSGMACLWLLFAFVYFHPRPFRIVEVSRLVQRWKQKKKQMERASAAASAVTDGNLSVQRSDDEIIVV